jgi:hypothetical protein
MTIKNTFFYLYPYLSSEQKTDEEWLLETSINVYQTTRHRIPEVYTLDTRLSNKVFF